MQLVACIRPLSMYMETSWGFMDQIFGLLIDICNSCNSNILSLADNTTMYMSDSNIHCAYLNANKEINNVYTWLCEKKNFHYVQIQLSTYSYDITNGLSNKTINKTTFNSHTDSLFHRSRKLKICDLYQYDALLYIYDIVHHNLPIHLTTDFAITVRFKDIRHANRGKFLHFSMLIKFRRKTPTFLLSLTSVTNGRPRFPMDPECTSETLLNQVKVCTILPSPVKCTN